MSDITIRESWENFSAACYFSKPYPNSDGSKCYKDPNIPKCEQTTCMRLIAHRMYVENRKRDAAPEMYALLERYANEGREGDAVTYYNTLLQMDAEWRSLRARINGEESK